MKTRLLRKIKKRFSWYKTTTNKYPEPYWVLLDRKEKTVVVLNLDYLLKYYTIKAENVEPHYYDNLLKIMITEPFVEDYFNKVKYRKATRIYERKMSKL